MLQAQRNRHRASREAFSGLLAVSTEPDTVSGTPLPRTLLPAGAPTGVPAGGSVRSAVRQAWVDMLSPVFTEGSIYFTGTYSDEYGMSHGCMLTRNVQKDFQRFLGWVGFGGAYIVGVEPHRERSVLHLHAILAGSFGSQQRDALQALWQTERGWAKALPVLDGCSSYVTKYALKGDSSAFEWRL